MSERTELKGFADLAQRAGFEVADAYTENRYYGFDEVAYIDFAKAATPEVVLELIAESERLQAHVDEMTSMREAHGFESWAAVLVAIEETKQERAEDAGGLLNVIAQMAGALKRLTFCARTTGGVAGQDALLMMACDDAEKILSLGSLGAAFMAGADAAEAKEPGHD